MAEPTKLTQAQALFAVLAGAAQARRERVYYRDGVLRSSLYLIPHSDDSNTTASLREGPLNGEPAYADISQTVTQFNFSFTSVRKDYTEDHDEVMRSVLDFNIAMTYVGIAYPIYIEDNGDGMLSNLNFNIAMTYTEILFPVYTEGYGDSMNSVINFNIAMTKS